ncbi:MAG: DUF6265 family protein [Polaribacter sp.]|jgi:hypothetical protein|nr:DUF6265 family protein [Polaribacter sp.]MDG1954426.1 DUF6265 family protein [Polaribacter sp.]MDG2074473.1 DUF6265 family protein [Polaribacter sp.]
MRSILFLVCLIFITSCNTKIKPHKPNFLLGKWIRTNDKPGNTTYEIWNKNFTGLGITLKEKDTTFKEILSIVSINDTLTLKVEDVNATPTLFQFTSQTDTSFVAENPTHDFPTKIKYWLENKQLKAHVSNAEFGIDFTFKRLKK